MLGFRVARQQIGRAGRRDDAAVLDLGVQDTGPDGALWALRLRGCTPDPGLLLWAWTLRGAPHAYRRADAAAVAAATAPFSEADAGKRVFDAARPLKAAGIPVLDALDHVAEVERDIVVRPTVKGEVSRQLAERLGPPYLRWCRPCQATHAYEQTFRLAALRGGLELEPGTSPPVLRRIPGWRGPAPQVPEHLDAVRGVLRLLGPSTPRLVAEFLDARLADVKVRWPDDVASVEVDGEPMDVLAADADELGDPAPADGVRLLGPFDLLLQARDRQLVVPDPAARKDLWRTLGRPGGVIVGHQLVGSWRPRTSGRRLRVEVTMWDGGDPPPGTAQAAELLADFRGADYAGLVAS